MNRLVGIFIMVVTLYGLVMISDPNARSLNNQRNLAQRVGQAGFLTLGAGILILSGGLDLSIGSVVGLSAVSLALLLEARTPPVLAISVVLAGSVLIGLAHGLLVTKLRLQPFIVTLCGLFIYRGLAQWVVMIRWKALWENLTGGSWSQPVLGSSRAVGLGGHPQQAALHFLAAGDLEMPIAGLPLPLALLMLLGVAAVLFVLLHLSVYGRYLYAIGYNEQAARYAGVSTDRYKMAAYILCALLAGWSGVLLLLDVETAQPGNAGLGYELYAITGAVLGGCSLRGGEGTILGMLLGTAALPLLRNLCQLAGIKSEIEPTIIGIALLVGTIVDELLKRRGAAGK